MPVLASKGTTPVVERLFDCGSWDAFPVGKNGWTASVVDCDGEVPRSRRPWAESLRYTTNQGTTIGGGGIAGITATAPLTAIASGGIVNIGYDALLFIIALLDALPGPYDKDEDALDPMIGNLSVGDWYLTSTAHVSLPYGVPKKIQ